MRRRRTFQSVLALAVAAAPLAAGGAASQAADIPLTRCDIAVRSQDGQVRAATILHDLGTGEQNLVRDAYGAADTKWDVVSPTAGPAYSVAPNSAWVDVPNHNWINVRTTNASSGGTSGTGGTVELDATLPASPADPIVDPPADPDPVVVGPTTATFRTRFVLPAQGFLERLNLEYAADNGVIFKLNGVQIGGYSPAAATHTAFDRLHSLVYTGPLLRAGSNTLDAIVTDYGVSTGLVVKGGYDGCAVKYVAPGLCISTSDSGITTWAARRIPLNTGSANGSTRDAYGSIDQKWREVSPNAGDAFSVAPYPGWYDDSTVSNWIHATADPRTGGGVGIGGGSYEDLLAIRTSGSSSAAGSGLLDVVAGPVLSPPAQYRYRIQFSLPRGASYRDLDLKFAADNGVQFFLNGVPIGGLSSAGATDHTPFNQLHPLLWAGGGFGTGTNTLDAVVSDLGVASGLIVEGAARVCDPIGVPVDLDDVIQTS